LTVTTLTLDYGTISGSARLNVNGNMTWTNGSMTGSPTTSGTTTIANRASLTIGAGAKVPNAWTINSFGTVMVQGGAQVTLAGLSLFNLGTLSLAAGSALTLSNYTQAMGALVLASTPNAPVFPLTVTGNATLGGTLKLNFVKPPSDGDTIPILGGTSTGHFKTVNVTHFPPNLRLVAQYGPFPVSMQVRQRPV
jgi:hypothetical protein